MSSDLQKHGTRSHGRKVKQKRLESKERRHTSRDPQHRIIVCHEALLLQTRRYNAPKFLFTLIKPIQEVLEVSVCAPFVQHDKFLKTKRCDLLCLQLFS